jgi:hypothetical protein
LLRGHRLEKLSIAHRRSLESRDEYGYMIEAFGQSRLNTKARGAVYNPAEAGATAMYGCTAAAWAEAGKIGIFSQLQRRNSPRGKNGCQNGYKQCSLGNLFKHV